MKFGKDEKALILSIITGLPIVAALDYFWKLGVFSVFFGALWFLAMDELLEWIERRRKQWSLD